MDIRLVIFDLDDTLYPEIQFVYSGFLKVSEYLSKKFNRSKKDFFRFLVSSFEKGIRGNNFDLLLEEFDINEDINTLVQIYRNHYPKISLYPDSKYILEYLRIRGFKIALITDGYLTTQLNKINALGIWRYFDKIVINDISLGIDKKKEEGFLEVLNALNVDPNNAIYIGDNPKKDFVVPNKLGMSSIRIIREEGIYKLVENNNQYPPKFIIYNLRSLIKVLEKCWGEVI